MNFSFLKAFYHVAECKSFTLASKRLNLSQPTLSLQVQGLEKSYGLPLIKRHQKRFELTTEGNLVFSYARSIFSLVADLEKAIEDLGARGLKIGSTPTLAHYIMPNIIRVLKQGNPQLKIQLFTPCRNQSQGSSTSSISRAFQLRPSTTGSLFATSLGLGLSRPLVFSGMLRTTADKAIARWPPPLPPGCRLMNGRLRSSTCTIPTRPGIDTAGCRMRI